MEKNPSKVDRLNSRERLQLFSKLEPYSKFFLEQLVAAPVTFRETYIPIFSIAGAMMHEDLSAVELNHFRKMIAIESDVLKTIPKEAQQIEDLREYVEREAISEVVEWRDMAGEDRKPQVWKNAVNDVGRLKTIVSARLNQ